MIENSSVGLAMLEAEVPVTVTGEERYQAELARYRVAPGAQREVAVELGWCTIGSGKYRGEHAIEVRLDGRRVGELTHLMSQRYGWVVSQVAARGGRPGCEAVVELGARGLEIILRLPRRTGGSVPIPAATPAPMTTRMPATPMPPATPLPAPRRGIFAAHKPAWIAAAVAAIIVIAALASNGNDPAPSAGPADATTTTVEPAPTTTTTTTTVAPKPAPPKPAPPKPTPRTTTEEPAPPPPPAEPEPASTCDPNYSGCVPIASDVDCAGGSGNGPAYVAGPIDVIGTDIYGLDRDSDGVACE
ncbi:hypothetical protein [Actinophytocola sp.]|uniref:hypothetical protein n=1 Tax=Actinophytocola sp. TaxID=1872138 RepID=UPI002EDA4AF0